MKADPAPPPAAPPPDLGFRQRPAWLIALLAVLAVQAGLTLRLFGREAPVRELLGDQPVVSGRHALHLYHGQLGARAWLDRRATCSFDPAFHAGYPKTPIFDGGSRPAELFLLFAGGASPAAAYKVGLAVCCLLVPLAFAGVARGVGLGPGVACLTAALGVAAWWAPPTAALLVAGDLDLLIGGLAGLVHLSWLARFGRRPNLDSWLVLLVTSCLGWFAHPVLWAALAPVALAYYLATAARRGLGWHLALAGVAAGGLLANAESLADWGRYAWIRMPLFLGDGYDRDEAPAPPGWRPSLAPGRPEDLAVAGLAAGGLIGLAGWRCRRGAAGLLGLTAAALVLAAGAGLAWPPLRPLGLDRLPGLALAWAVCPCASALAAAGRRLASRRGLWFAAGAVAGTVGAGLWWPPAVAPLTGPPALAVGLTPERQALVRTLSAATTADARILWEDRPAADGAYWTPLLPLLTGRAYLGGLDPEGYVEHAHARLAEGSLAGRPLAEWSDGDLERFCDRYNVGWVACWSPEAVARFRAWPGATVTAYLSDAGVGQLFAMRRAHSFVLKGRARWLQADDRRVALADVEPSDGVVVLSLHHQAGWRVAPSDVVIERDPDPEDPIPFLRLRLAGPVARLTLTWESP
jgi:hypothetical protein